MNIVPNYWKWMAACCLASFCGLTAHAQTSAKPPLIAGEALKGESVWIAPELKKVTDRPVRIVVWFDQQFLGDGKAYQRRAKEFANSGRRELRSRVVQSLKTLSAKSHSEAKNDLTALQESGAIKDVTPHWIINGFSCTANAEGIEQLAKVKGVKKIFAGRRSLRSFQAQAPAPLVESPNRPSQTSSKNLPWYISKLHADKVWKELGVTGEGTLNIVHDSNFIMTPSLARSVYTNAKETPNNGKDDDGNGLIDDYHGYNFNTRSPNLTTRQLKGDATDRKNLHGTSCAHIICGVETDTGMPQFGIAPMAKWAGVITSADIESAVEWAIEQGADTYSMSFSIPHLGETRSHWRKLMEHGSFCGVFFVSGAGNFATSTKVPVQMRTPEDIPEAVFAAAGVQKDLSRTLFSSQGPVEWKTEHYREGRVQKPEVCAFNHGVPLLMPDGQVIEGRLNGNSFAGPMFCGTIALMLSADPDLLPWDLKKIITRTATDVGPKGVDYQTGHGLIHCYKAVAEVIRLRELRKASQ
ncbi:S8 family serine peptidase [Verrucomicrobiaceae bacterium R5-34]|nr:S8 family serine peptidase [Verrucomicrobiaceae bacterium R5-34]